MNFESVIGLEVHVQLATNTKMFCRCSTKYSEQPNSNVCEVCLGLPGSLPSINQKAVEFAVKLGQATNSTINLDSVFARKNYFYPDLPKSYQISQFEEPICENGYIDIEVENKSKRIGITRIHMEEDAGKLIHQGRDYLASYVDLNRAGIPLLEVVSEPDLRTPEEAKAYMEKIYSIVTYLEICLGDMERGNLRCDANVSIRKKGETKLNTRAEVKNLNSFRFVSQAIEYEINRQIDANLDGEKIVQETRLFDSSAKTTYSMRTKEDSHDYRYFPCPDLPEIKLVNSELEAISKSLPELPDAKHKRFISQYNLSEKEASILVSSKEQAQYFEEVVKNGAPAKKATNWILGDFSRALNEKNLKISQSKINPHMLAKLIGFIESGKISGKMAKEVFNTMFETGQKADEIIQKQGLSQISDKDLIQKLALEVIQTHPSEVEQFLKGKDRVLGFFVGKIMAKTKGKANPKMVSEQLVQAMNALVPKA